MPRKTRHTDAAPTADTTNTSQADAATGTAVVDAPPTPAGATPEQGDVPTDGTGKHYGPPYKALFTSDGFELGENRRFKQRVFTFRERPADDVIAALKEQGFTYRAAEKAWTTPATAESRVLSDRLAQRFAGGNAAEPSVGR